MNKSDIWGYVDDIKNMISNLDKNRIQKLANMMENTKKTDNIIFIIGNGGSASTASHWACDLGKGTIKNFNDSKDRLKVISLTDNVSTITAYGNDISYDEIFSQQLKNLMGAGDLLIVLSGSGKSRNIIKAINAAKEAGVYVFSLLGFDGGEAVKISDDCIIIPSRNYGVIEDVHMSIGHIVTALLKGENNFIHS